MLYWVQGHGEGPKASTSGASEAPQVKPCAWTRGSVSLKFAFRLTLSEKTGLVGSKKPAQTEQKKSGPRADIGGSEHHPHLQFF